MTQNPGYEGIKMDIQAIGVEMNDYLHQRLHNMLEKVKNFFPAVNGIDVYFKKTDGQAIPPRKVKVRFAIPGPDVIASDAGHSWKPILKSVERKLIRQLKKRKAQAAK